jgi:hypothetical protein
MSEESKDKSFRQLEVLSFVHSAIYFGLLACWLFEGPALLRNRLGWAHGLLWIGMTILVIIAARKAVVSFRLAVLVAVIGGLGPFAGTAGFVLEGRQRKRDRSVAHPTSNDAPS